MNQRRDSWRPLWAAFVALLLILPAACSENDGSGSGPDAAAPDGPVADSVAAPDAGSDAADQGAPANVHREQVEALVAPMLDHGWTAGLVVGLIGPQGEEIYGFGATETGGSSVPEKDTLFEIGSITKTFTSLALARMVQQGSVSLDQPVQQLLPAGEVTVPQKNGTQITLEHLSTHVSGLPRMPTNFEPADENNPYVDYDAERLYAFLDSYSLTREPGVGWLYSNLAVGLLGHALSLEAGVAYDDLVGQLTDELGMADTVIEVSSAQQPRLAQGHDDALEPVAHWDFGVLAPAGALRSTAADMLAYIAAQAGIDDSALAAAMAETHEVRFSHPDLTFAMGLGWIIHDDRYRWHNGGTQGFATFAGFDPQTKTGAVVLSNTSTAQNPETLLGLALLRMMAGERYEPPKLPPTVTLPVATLDSYTGTFAGVVGSAQLQVTIERDGGGLYWQPASAPKASKMYAAAEATFYLRSNGFVITFVADSQGSYDVIELAVEGQTFTLDRVP